MQLICENQIPVFTVPSELARVTKLRTRHNRRAVRPQTLGPREYACFWDLEEAHPLFDDVHPWQIRKQARSGRKGLWEISRDASGSRASKAQKAVHAEHSTSKSVPWRRRTQKGSANLLISWIPKWQICNYVSPGLLRCLRSGVAGSSRFNMAKQTPTGIPCGSPGAVMRHQ